MIDEYDEEDDELEYVYVGGSFSVEDDDEQPEEVEFYAVRPNKTQIKRELSAIFDMAQAMSELSSSHLAEFDLPEPVFEALSEAGRMKRDAARKRLLKYVTQQMRHLDIEAIRDRLARLKTQSAHGVREHHQAERWRDLLLGADGQHALTDLLDEFPQMDRQHLRQLQRNALKEAQSNKPPKSARQLYQYLKHQIAQVTQADFESEQDDEPDLSDD